MRATQLGSAQRCKFALSFFSEGKSKRHLGGPHLRAMTKRWTDVAALLRGLSAANMIEAANPPKKRGPYKKKAA